MIYEYERMIIKSFSYQLKEKKKWRWQLFYKAKFWLTSKPTLKKKRENIYLLKMNEIEEIIKWKGKVDHQFIIGDSDSSWYFSYVNHRQWPKCRGRCWLYPGRDWEQRKCTLQVKSSTCVYPQASTECQIPNRRRRGGHRAKRRSNGSLCLGCR